MSSLKESFSKYNLEIKQKGFKKYIFRVLLTTILQTLAIALIPSLIDNNYDTFTIKALVIFIVLLIINIPLYFFGVWKSL